MDTKVTREDSCTTGHVGSCMERVDRRTIYSRDTSFTESERLCVCVCVSCVHLMRTTT